MILCWRRHGKAGGCQINNKIFHILNGGVAQLGEHLPCKQGVKSSNLSISIRRKQLGLRRTTYLENCILKIWYKVQTERFETNIKTSEVLHESVTKQATNKPKTNGATLCIREWGSKPAWGKRSFRKSSIFFMPFASQMSSHFLISPYESKLSTAFLKNNWPLSYLNWSSYKERRVDALALRADERRDKLR